MEFDISEDHFDGQKYYYKQLLKEVQPGEITTIIVTLPETQVPFRHGSDDKKNIINFEFLFKKIILEFPELEKY